MIRSIFAGALFALLALAPARAAIQIQRVVSPGGIEAWLVEDHHIPILALDLSFQGGTAVDPAGRDGLAMLTAAMMNEGAGPLDSMAFQKELADKSIAFAFTASTDRVSGSLKTLTRYRDRAFELLGLALTKPRFDSDAVERNRNQMLSELASNLGSPNYIARRKLMETMFAGHPYSHTPLGTAATIRAITADDMRGFLKRRFGRDALLVTAAGDITPAELGPALDKMFGQLPTKAEPFEIAEVTAKGAGQTITLERPIPQTIIMMAEAGIKRRDPDWWPAQILNYTLGGGGFNSRLMEAVRGAGSKKGLSYGVSSALAAYKHTGVIQAGGSTKNATAGETLAVIRDEFARMHSGGISESELTDAKANWASARVCPLLKMP